MYKFRTASRSAGETPDDSQEVLPRASTHRESHVVARKSTSRPKDIWNLRSGIVAEDELVEVDVLILPVIVADQAQIRMEQPAEGRSTN